MSKIFGWFGEYKWVLVALAFVAVAAGSWDISSKVAENEYNQERVILLNKTIEVALQNEKLRSEITKTLLDGLRVSREEIKKSNQEAINEILKDPVYKSCRITDGVRNAYKSAIKAQSAK